MPLSGQFGVVSEITNGALPGFVEIGGLRSPSAQDGGACSQGGWAEGMLSGHRGIACGVPGVTDDVQGNCGASGRDLFSLYTRPLTV